MVRLLSIVSCILLGIPGETAIKAQKISKEVVSGTIYRQPNGLTVDQYSFSLKNRAGGIVEFDILSAETADNVTFVDVNKDCDSSYIDSQIYLFKRSDNGNVLDLVASNDDEGDENSGYVGKGRKDGSLGIQDSYLIRQLTQGDYVLAVGRYPLSMEDAKKGFSTDKTKEYTPYACQTPAATYGNYQLTIRAQTIDGRKILTKFPNSYIGNSCNTLTPASDDNSASNGECLFALGGDYQEAIQQTCSYDLTVY